jgi:FtsZ-binding cell division protein ZapB
MSEFVFGGIVAGLAILSCAVVVFANLAIKLKIEVEALKNSTHSIQYVPVDKETAFEELTEKEKESLKQSMNHFGEEINFS